MVKAKNPLYHISKDGKDVESVSNFFELLVKRFGLEPVITFLESMFEFMVEQVQSYAIFISLKEMMDELIEKLFKVIEKVQPLLAKL